eukprot:TRINITY_DN43478_c0_g1_i1.p3 TRINITY_DN43478_c0_g1~~TRINITY_DN43478_c0_g1_i1.p3  ORF type:complete len:174 (+),score=18.79 TRINITY_DN43478_c0_g1_i1:52-573(+)
MEKITVEQAEELISYFNENVLSSDFEGEGADHVLKVKVKNGVDLDRLTNGGYLAWNDHGEYPLDFKAIITSEDGKQASSFDYVGTAGIVPDLEIDEYDALLDFKEFWHDDVAKKFNTHKEVEFIIQDGIDVMKASKLIFEYINESTKLGSDITVILIDSMGERTNLFVPANTK